MIATAVCLRGRQESWAKTRKSVDGDIVVGCQLRRPTSLCHVSSPSRIAFAGIESRATYARELRAAVAALGDSAALLDVQQSELATGGLDDSGPVGSSVVAVGKISVSPCRGDLRRLERGSRSVVFGQKDCDEEHSRVATAVGNSLRHHFGWSCWACAMRISPSRVRNFEIWGKFCVGGGTDCARQLDQ